MDPPFKKRSLFGLGNLFRGSSTPASDVSDAPKNALVPAQSMAPAPSRVDSASASSAHESPVKRASESQMAARKIISRPHGPSSKLSQSVSASDFTRLSSGNATAIPRRMPGDNPNKPPPAAAPAATTAAYTPAHSFKSTNFSGAATTPRNIFRSSALYSRPGLPNFTPRAPANAQKQQPSFPPSTPGRNSRGISADVNGRILAGAGAGSTDLFKMRIPSPPRHLTGEALAKEVPEDSNRTGSIYADEFLAHYCPPDLDEQQRRQFFCILDLRRLKYAADEVFTGKDWKINILNFAKEYEKSRSLIMLRYGLYEFKTVRASETVKKEWKQKHGIPESDDEGAGSPAPKTNGSSKRKASEELTPASNALTTSASAGNKRARAPEMSGSLAASVPKAKRKADAVGEPDENHPSKLQKAASSPQKTPSATKSVFESIANGAFSATPAKLPSKTGLFSASTTKLANGSLSRSVFDAGAKTAPASNIFGHLSDASKGSGNEGADEDSETSSNAEEDESEGQDTEGGKQATSSGTSGTSGSSSDAGEGTQGRSIFDRITRDSDGQPVRQPPAQEASSVFSPPAETDRSESPKAQVPATAAPVNKTWNANTPIKFGPATGTSLFGAAAAQAAGEKATPAKTDAPAQSLFGGFAKKADETKTTSDAAKVQPSANLFSFTAKPADAPSAAAAPLFGAAKPSASASPSLFASNAPSFGQKPAAEDAKATALSPAPSPAPAAPSPFAAPSTAVPAAAPEPPKPSAFSSSTLFGKSDAAPAPAPAPPPQQPAATPFVFKPVEASASAAKPTGSLFATGTAKPAGSLFGAPSPAASGAEEPAAKKFAFGSTETKPASTLFGSTTTATSAATETMKLAESKSLFGATPAASTEAKPLFGAPSAAPAEGKPLFGAMPSVPSTVSTSGSTNGSTSASTEIKPLFVTSDVAHAGETKPIFGGFTSTATPAPGKPLFGGMTGNADKPLFGNTTGNTDKPLFGNTATTTDTKTSGLFGNATPAAPAFSFGASQSTVAAPSFGASQTPTASQQPSFGASQTPAAPAASQTSQAGGSIFGLPATTSFSFTAGGDSGVINNPFATNGSGVVSAPSSFNFGSDSQTSSAPFQFGAGPAAPSISFGGVSDNGAPSPGTSFVFGGGASQPSGNMFAANPAGAPIFGNTLAPGGGTSTGTNTPFTFGGASSLATTPAASTPEPAASAQEGQGTNADGDEAPQEQISLIDGGPGEEHESVVHEIRAKAVKLVPVGDSDDDPAASKDKKKSPWKTQGVGPLRVLKHKTTGKVRMLLRAEPSGNVALNRAVLPNFSYKADTKYVKLTTGSDDGKSLETWMLQLKSPAAAEALAAVLEEHKTANEKK